MTVERIRDMLSRRKGWIFRDDKDKRILLKEIDRLTALCADNVDIVDSLMAEVKRQDKVIAELRDRLEPIEEVYKKWGTIKEFYVSMGYDAWQAVKKAMEG